MKNIHFYNLFHNGDLHYSREFVKDIINKVKNKYKIGYYIKKLESSSLNDIDIEFKNVDKNNILSTFLISNCQKIIKEEQNDIFVNTWIGTNNAKYVSKHKCSLKSNYLLYKDIFAFLDIPIDSISNYIPSIDYSKFKIESIDKFFNNNKQNFYCLISNGPVHSGQANCFDLSNIINILSKKYLNIGFILTHKTNLEHSSNIFYTNDIIGLQKDLNEISYLSLKCKIIFGRASGPYCFSHVKENMFDIDKTIIANSNFIEEGLWAMEDDFENKKHCKQIWLNTASDEELMNIIQNEIDVKLESKI